MEQPREIPVRDHVLATPVWVFVIRIAQIVLAVIVLGLAATIAHGAYLDELGFALAISVITWVAVKYSVLTEKIGSFRAAYNIIAVLVLDGLLIIFWLATFAAVAARRAKFVVDVNVGGCSNNGGLFNSESCYYKRAVILFKAGRDMMSAIAGIGALLWILFIVTFVWTLVSFLRARKEGRFQFSTNTATTANFQMEPKMEEQQPSPPLIHAGQYDQTTLAQGVPPPAQSPYQQQPPYSPPPQGAYSPPPHGQPPITQYASHQYPPQYPQPYPQQQQQPSQQHYQPHGTELPAEQQFSTPSLVSNSPPPPPQQQQPYHPQ